ncbi:MAG: hypothetical protein ABI405_11735 [Parafilimonas sp.]
MIKEVLYYFEGLDRSILRLNDHLINYHFEFVLYNPKEFEEKFKNIIIVRKNSDYGFDDDMPEKEFSFGFLFGLEDLKYFNVPEIIKDEYVIFLRHTEIEKRLEDKILEGQTVLNSDTDLNEIKVDNRIESLVNKLKLFKTGHIKLISAFEFTDALGCVGEGYFYPTKRIKYNKYHIDNIPQPFLLLENQLEIPSYLELAFNSFLEYYNIEDERLKFVVLMISLESIFNKSNQDPITHIISRHVALLIAENKESFFKVYDEVKRLYNIRSAIVHGKDEKESKKDLKDVEKDILILEEIVRSVLRKLIWIYDFDLDMPSDKKSLWNYLNAKGFED